MPASEPRLPTQVAERRYAPLFVLLGHILPRLRDDGIEQFDFVGANTPSIAEFKRHFGPVLTPYFYLEKITRPELRLLYRLKGR